MVKFAATQSSGRHCRLHTLYGPQELPELSKGLYHRLLKQVFQMQSYLQSKKISHTFQKHINGGQKGLQESVTSTQQ